MTKLHFKGKEFVYDHHLSVRSARSSWTPKKSVSAPALNGNVVIHSDNLHALKALRPFWTTASPCRPMKDAASNH